MFAALVGVDRGLERAFGGSIEGQTRLGVDLFDLGERSRTRFDDLNPRGGNHLRRR